MRFVQPCEFTGTYPNNWAGYKFKETLGYTTGKHTGVDYNFGSGDQDFGKPILSISTGIVRYTGDKSNIGFGKTTIIEYPLNASLKAELGCDSLFARYMHQDSILVGVGQKVDAGQKIGTVGKTGTKYAHLHLDLYKSTIGHGGVHLFYDKDTQLASYLDPYIFIESHKTVLEDDMPIPDNDNYYWRYGQKLAERLRGRQLSRDEFRKHLVGRSDLQAVEILSDDPEADRAQEAQNIGFVAIRDGWGNQIHALTAEKNEASNRVAELSKALSIKEAEIAKLQVQTSDPNLTIKQAIRVLVTLIKDAIAGK